MEVSITILKSGFAVFIAILGAILIILIKKLTHKQLCALISFSAGILLSVNIFTILPEGYELTENLIAIAIAFIFGYALFYLIGKYVFHVCPACSATHTETFLAVSSLMVFAFSIHSFLDGVGIAMEEEAEDIGLIFLAVALHKIPEGVALATIGLGSNFSKRKTFLFVVGIQTATLIGGIIGIFLAKNISLFFVGIILSFVGGGFLYLVIHAMVGEMIKHEKKSVLVYGIIGFLFFGITALGFRVL